MGNPTAERTIFEAFLRAMPDFAREKLRDWTRAPIDPPDILCTTVSGRTVGVELGEWLNEEQMHEAKGLEAVQDSITKAIGVQPNNACQNIYYAWLHPRPRVRVRPTDSTAFREEIFKLVADADRRNDPDPAPQGWPFQDFGGSYPTVQKYLLSITFFPRRQWHPDGSITDRTWPAGVDWLTFSSWGGAYNEEPMVNALCSLIAKKIEKYDLKPPRARMDEFHLLIHYNQALLYNTPVETLRFKFADAARAGAELIRDDPGIFDKVFLMLATEPEQRVFQLYPA